MIDLSVTSPALLILVVGPDPAAVRAATVDLFDAGHAPVTWEGLADPPTGPAEGRARYAARLVLHCDAVLRLSGPMAEADRFVDYARWEGKPVYHGIGAVPRTGSGRPSRAVGHPPGDIDYVAVRLH
jgi:hypothetical protein